MPEPTPHPYCLEQEKRAITISERFPAPQDYVDFLRSEGSENLVEAYQLALQFCERVKQAGGQAFLVGGVARDHGLNRVCNDFDIEVYNLEPAIIQEIAESLGSVRQMGRVIAILKLSTTHGLDLDIVLPRPQAGFNYIPGQKFADQEKPQTTIRQSASMRDFTVNAMLIDPLSGDILDPYGGWEDLQARRLKVVDAEAFSKDPIRAIRALSFMNRFLFQLDETSLPAVRDCATRLHEIPGRRLNEEWYKLLVKGEKPSLGLAAGLSLGAFTKIAPHLPGNHWEKILIAVDQAAQDIRKQKLEPDPAFSTMLACICPTLDEATDKFLRSLELSGGIYQRVVSLIRENNESV